MVEKKLPLVSVIVPVYKAEKFINRCVDSILNQSYKNLELILINDGSPDDSGRILDEYALKDKRVKVIHQSNAGVSVARNEGLNIFKGEYVCFVDADDYIDVDLIYDNLELIYEKQADVVCFNYCKDYGTHREGVLDYRTNFTDIDIITPFFLDYASRAVWNKFYKRTLWESLRFPENMPFAEDWFVLSHIYIYASKMVATKNVYYFYNLQNESSICRTICLKYKYYDFLCNKHQLYLLTNKLEKLIELKNVWIDIVMEKAFNRCLDAYKSNLYSNELTDIEKEDMYLFLINNKVHIKNLKFREKVRFYILMNIPVIYRIKLWMFHCRTKISLSIRSCFK